MSLKKNKHTEEIETEVKEENREEKIDENAESANTEAENPDGEISSESVVPKEQYLRLCAEFDNFRKRTKLEKDMLADFIKADTIALLLPVIDNLERAVAIEVGEDDPLKAGLTMTYNNCIELLKKIGVESFGEAGEKFTPNFHHSVSTAESGEIESGGITIVMQRGYKWGDKVIRPALVQVAQ